MTDGQKERETINESMFGHKTCSTMTINSFQTTTAKSSQVLIRHFDIFLSRNPTHLVLISGLIELRYLDRTVASPFVVVVVCTDDPVRRDHSLPPK